MELSLATTIKHLEFALSLPFMELLLELSRAAATSLMTLLLKITSFDQFGAILAPVASKSNNKTNGFSNTNKEQKVPQINEQWLEIA